MQVRLSAFGLPAELHTLAFFDGFCLLSALCVTNFVLLSSVCFRSGMMWRISSFTSHEGINALALWQVLFHKLPNLDNLLSIHAVKHHDQSFETLLPADEGEQRGD